MLNVYEKGNVVLDSTKKSFLRSMLCDESRRFSSLSLPYFGHSALGNDSPTSQNKKKNAPALMQSILYHYIIDV